MTFKHLYEHLCVFLNKGDLRSGKYSKYAEKQILTQHLVDFFSFIITLGFNSCTSPCSNHVFSVFIRKAFWEAVRMATNVNTSGPPPPPPRLPLLPIGFATAPKAGENGKLGSQRGPLLRKDNVSSAEHTRKVRTVGVFVL